jgi:hypothetical protein
MQRGWLIASDEVGEHVRQPLDAEWVALEDGELEHHFLLLLLQV